MKLAGSAAGGVPGPVPAPLPGLFPRWTGRCWTSPGTTRVRPLAEPSAEAVLAEINGWDADGKPLPAYTKLKDDGSTACGCWIYCGVYADSGRTRPRAASPAASRAGSPPTGAGPGPPTGASCTTARPPIRGQAVERAQGPGAGGTLPRASGRGMTCRLRARQGAGLPAAFRRDRRGGARRHRPVHHAGRRQGLAVRAGRACRRAAARALRAAGLAAGEPRLPGSSATPSGRCGLARIPDNRFQPSNGSPGSHVFPYVATTYR